MTVRVAVVGGGISGLTAAYRLRTLLGDAATITVLESGDALGGKLRTISLADRPFDVGAEAFLARRPEAMALIDEVGLTQDRVHPTPARASLRVDGHTVALPAQTMMGIPAAPAALDGVLPADGARAVAAEASRALESLPSGDVPLGWVLRDRFGDALVDSVVDPLLGGVYAGGADSLGLRAVLPGLAGALDAGARSVTEAAASLLPSVPSDSPVFATVTGGLAQLVARLVELARPEVRRASPVRSVRCTAERWRLELGAAAPAHAPAEPWVEADAVVLAVPPPSARRLLGDLAPAAAEAFAEVELASTAVVSVALPPETTVPPSSGVLIGAGERHDDGTAFTAKAFTFSSRKWAHHGGAGSPVLVRGSVGRFGEPSALRASDEELVRRVTGDLTELTGISTSPVEATVTRWGGALPQYGVGHHERVARIEEAIATIPMLEIAGAALHGVGIPACVGTGDAAAHRLATKLGG